MRRLLTAEEYIHDRVTISESGCWEWQRHLNGDGYATSWFRQRWQYAHRFSYETFVGPIPEGLTLDHLCRNRRCVNPEHLEPVTHKENVLRGDSWGGKNRRKTHCPKGHPLSGKNLLDVEPKRGRVCRICAREATRRANERKRRERGQVERDKFCKNGHPRTPENTLWSKDGKRRRCRVCAERHWRKTGGYKDPARERATHCPHGHEWTAENTYEYERKGRTYRYCRACNRAAARR